MTSTLDDLDHRVLARQVIVHGEPIPPWRWAVIVAVVASFLHDQSIARLGAPSFSEHLAAYAATLVPAPGAVRAWTLIQLTLVGYGIAQLLPSQRRVAVYDRLAGPVVLASLVTVVQRASLSSESPQTTALLSVVLAVVAGAAFVRAHAGIAHARRSAFSVYPTSRWIAAPIALLFGWSLVSAGATVDAALAHALGPHVLLAAIGATTVTLASRHRDPVMPALVAWLLTSICAGNIAPPAVAPAPRVSAAPCAAIGIVIATTRARPAASPSPSRRSHRA